MTMTHASVFSGIGGPEVAASMLGWENLFHCEINPFGKAVLDYWYPNAKSYDDITKTDFREWRGRVHVLTGGFPCQPFSYAGKRKGADDDRYLWPSMYRCIDEIRPDWVVAENVAGILTMVEQGEVSAMANQATLFDEADDVRGIYQLRETFTLQRICDDLTGHGYSVQPILIPACAVGAPHRRDRVFIIGRRIATDSRSGGQSTPEQQGERAGQTIQRESREQSFNGTCGLGSSSTPTDTDGLGSTPQGKSATSNRQWADEFLHALGERQRTASERSDGLPTISRDATDTDRDRGSEIHEHLEPEQPNGAKPFGDGRERNVADTQEQRGEQLRPKQSKVGRETQIELGGRGGESGSDYQVGERWANFPTVSPIHRGNDGLPFNVDNLTIPFPKWRTEALKAYGNAIVPQVMYEIFRAIQEVENLTAL